MRTLICVLCQFSPKFYKERRQMTGFCGDNIRTFWWRTPCGESSVLCRVRKQQNSWVDWVAQPHHSWPSGQPWLHRPGSSTSPNGIALLFVNTDRYSYKHAARRKVLLNVREGVVLITTLGWPPTRSLSHFYGMLMTFFKGLTLVYFYGFYLVLFLL